MITHGLQRFKWLGACGGDERPRHPEEALIWRWVMSSMK
jgi:hypothetical protein